MVKDCIHDVFVKIYTNRAKLTPTDNIIAYLMVALKNTLFNALKKTSDSFSLDEADEKEDQSEEHFSTPETLYINKVLLDGKKFNKYRITHDELVHGKRLIFDLK